MDDPDCPSNVAAATASLTSVDPPRNFSLPVGERIRAMTIGAPAYATRKKHIEDLEAAHERTLIGLHDALLARGRDARTIETALQDKASSFNLDKLNRLIATHNRYYAIEANLPVDPPTGEYMLCGKPWRPTATWTPAGLVERARAAIAARTS